ncbi:MAG: hypothetical protein ABMB14_03075 [Myxococcota bacterium]
MSVDGRVVAGAVLALLGVLSLSRPEEPSSPKDATRAAPDPGLGQRAVAAPVVVPRPAQDRVVLVARLGPPLPNGADTLHLDPCCNQSPANPWRATAGPASWIGPHLWRIPRPPVDLDPVWVGPAAAWLIDADPWLGLAAVDVLSWRRFGADRSGAPVLRDLVDAAVERAAGSAAEGVAVAVAAGADLGMHGPLGKDHQRALLDQIGGADPVAAAVAASWLEAPLDIPVDAADLAALRAVVEPDPKAHLDAVLAAVEGAIAADLEVEPWIALADGAAATCAGHGCGSFQDAWRVVRAGLAPPRDWQDATIAALLRCASRRPPFDPEYTLIGWDARGTYHLDGWAFTTTPGAEPLFDCVSNVEIGAPLGQRLAMTLLVDAPNPVVPAD